jgi:hypothetical protein
MIIEKPRMLEKEALFARKDLLATLILSLGLAQVNNVT